MGPGFALNCAALQTDLSGRQMRPKWQEAETRVLGFGTRTRCYEKEVYVVKVFVEDFVAFL